MRLVKISRPQRLRSLRRWRLSSPISKLTPEFWNPLPSNDLLPISTDWDHAGLPKITAEPSEAGISSLPGPNGTAWVRGWMLGLSGLTLPILSPVLLR